MNDVMKAGKPADFHDQGMGEMESVVADPRRTAIHEAAHAVIGRAMTMACGHATIVADENSSGHAITHDPYSVMWEWEKIGKYRDIESVYRGRIVTFLAGAVAEEVILGQCQGGDGDDQYQCQLMAGAAGFDARYVERLRCQTVRAVKHHRALIVTVADALERHGMLSGEAIDDLVEGAILSPEREPPLLLASDGA